MSKIDELMRQGLQLHQAGRLPEAQALYGKVLDKQPSHAAANHLMGVALLQRGDAAGAVTRLKRAVHVRGNDPEYLGNLGTALNAAGRPAEAIEVFDKALKLQPSNAGILNNRGMALRAVHRHDEGIASHRAACLARPDEPTFHSNLGKALSELGDWRGAEIAYRRALELAGNFPNALTGLTNALLALQRKDEAIATAAAFAQRFPNEPEYNRALGIAHWTSGNPSAAAAAYRTALAADPTDVEAHRMLGSIVIRSSEDAEVRAVESLLNQPGLSDDRRAQLEFTLGTAFDDIGDEGRASEHFARGNALIRKLRPFSIDSALAELSDLQRQWAEVEVPPLEAPTGPVFIVGLPRSGKTTLEGMLARHPAFFPAGELPVVGNLSFVVHQQGEEGAKALGTRYLAMAEALAPGLRILDTQPENFKFVGLLRQAIPSARILHVTRDPEAHARALPRKLYLQSGNDYTNDSSDLAAYLAGYRSLMSFWRQRFPDFIIDVASSTAGADMRSILDFLGAVWEPAVATNFVSEPRIRDSF